MKITRNIMQDLKNNVKYSFTVKAHLYIVSMDSFTCLLM